MQILPVARALSLYLPCSCISRALSAETILYSLIRARCPCYVSVGHRMQLLHFHTHVLEFCEAAEGAKGGHGEWVMCTAQEFQQRLASKGGEGLSLG